jgi:hypothetical protein
MSKRSESAMSPGWATFVAGSCTGIGIVSLLGGILVACVAGGSNAADAAHGVFTGIAVILSSLVWLALGCVVATLSQIAESVRRPEEG